MHIRPARLDEAAALSALALRSKAFWGYSTEFLERCRDELAVRPDKGHTLVAEGRTGLLGFVTITGAPPEGELDALFVEPAAVGRGVGRALLDAARALARAEGFRALAIQADPNAESFYLRHGAVRAGERPSASIPGRMLPLLFLTM